ncbi:Kelch-type beta propeller [Arabidopsis suecica]|uniref:Kelch-type beta propeller n=1 Tax=Arabidopsis suecica TaxID=45249 RepID=A0A8T2BRF3_ARASU|nr:Kelch-type beta propeller [Arabidopsis suecica]
MTPPIQKKKHENPSFLSLPEEIILTCLARIPRSYYPKLSIVCKTFRSLIVSKELNDARFHLKTQETVYQVFLQFTDNPRPSWYTLWIKPGQILTNQLEEEKTKSTQNIRLVQITSSCYSYVPSRIVSVGSEMYKISLSSTPSSNMWVRNKEIGLWRKAPNMTVAREKPHVGVLNGKIYALGGCRADESVNWGEVFDPKTQIWERLPDPGAKHRFSSIREIQVCEGNIIVISNEEWNSVYDPKEGKWDVAGNSCMQCEIDNLLYCCDQYNCFWYDKNREKWRVVRGLATLNKNYRSGMIEIAKYKGKLLILWDKFVQSGSWQYKDIWCALISFERRNNGIDEVWGNIEWASIVLTVPSSYVFLCGQRYGS